MNTAATLVKRGALKSGRNATGGFGGVTLGEYCFVAGWRPWVTRNVPDYALVMGVPARQVGLDMLLREGRPAPGFAPDATCSDCGRQYSHEKRHLPRTGGPRRNTADRQSSPFAA